jgi:hypothetical protein
MASMHPRGGSVVALAGLLALAALAQPGCDSGPKPVFSPPPKGTTLTVREVKAGGEVGGARPMKFNGERTIGSQKYQQMEVGHLERVEPDGERWFVEFEGDEVVFGGGEMFYPSSPDPAIPGVTVTVAAPIRLNLDPPVGEPQTVRVTGQVVIGNPSDPGMVVDVDEDATWVLVGVDEVVDTEMGTMGGARHYHVEATPMDMEVSGDVWLVDGVGVVKAEGNLGDMEGGMSLESIAVAAAKKNGYATIGAQQVVGEGRPYFRLNTYDVAGKSDADKNVHAKMFLEVRWADDALARTDARPPIVEEFGTGWGWYPSYLSMTKTSFFHTAESLSGEYRYWIAAVDQAAKNESFNPISYHVNATWQPSTQSEAADVRVSARILYKVFQE